MHLKEMITLARSPVHSDPELMGGTLVFQGTRVPAQTLLDYLRDGYDLEGFLEEFPSVERQDAEEFLHLVSDEKKPSGSAKRDAAIQNIAASHFTFGIPKP
jgi:uncharacterized protein (DUF433 family)